MKENKDIQPVEDIKDTSLFVEDGEDVFKDYEQKFEASGEDNREYDHIDSVEAYTEPVLENSAESTDEDSFESKSEDILADTENSVEKVTEGCEENADISIKNDKDRGSLIENDSAADFISGEEENQIMEVASVQKNRKKKKEKSKNKKKTEKKATSVIHSINTKISRNIIFGILFALVVTYFVTMSGFKQSIDSLVKTNMITAVNTYNTLLEDTILLTKNNLTTSNLTSLFKEEGLSGVETSHISLVDENGNYTFNVDYTLIGQKVTSDKILDLVNRHNKKEKLEPDVIEVTQGDKTYYVGYYACDNGWLLLCTAEKAELYQIYDEVKQRTLIGAVIILVVFAVLGFVASKSITKPIKKLTSVIHKTAGLDFRPNPELDKLCKRKDETGEMSKALLEMQVAVKGFVSKIETASININDNANSLKELSSLVNDNSTDNSATTQELAAGMEETSASTAHVEENINNILSSIDSISDKTKDGQILATKIMDKAAKLKENTITASNNGKEMFANVRKETSVAIEKSKDVDKINLLTKTILDISDQTSLLSINASIEAARAGEAGRGFAVVAEQIGHLANLSASTVENIGEIVEEVNDAVNSMAECLERTLNFLEEKVINDYGGFISVSDEYNSDAVLFEKSMKEIYNSITELEHSTTVIADAISGINSTISDSSIGVSDIAEKTSDIVGLTVKTNEMVDESVNYSQELESVVELFKL